MAKKTKHSKAQIARKLAEANDLAEQGKPQSEIAHALGVSVMTLHRWRKLPPQPNGSGRNQTQQTRTAELELENSRLRRLVTDLLLEKMSLEVKARGVT
jgi:transposase-like protein